MDSERETIIRRMGEFHGKPGDQVTVREHARMCGEMYVRFCQATVDYPWSNFVLEREQLWDTYCGFFGHPFSTTAAQRMAEAEAYFGLRDGCGATLGAK